MRKILALFIFGAVAMAQTPAASNLFQVTPNSTNTTNGKLEFLDTSGFKIGFQSPMLSANTLWMLPAADAAGCLESNGSAVLSFTTCGSASVANGFIVNGKTTVAPPNTSMGLQVWYDPTLHTTNLLSYDNAAALSQINLSASLFAVQATTTSFSGNIAADFVGTQIIGTHAAPFGGGFFLNNASTRKVEIYDVSATDLTSPFWWIQADVVAGLNVVLHFKDNGGNDMLTLSRIHTGANHEGLLDADWLPALDNTYDIGAGLFRWRNITAVGAVAVGSLTCTGTPCGGIDISKGFFVNNNTGVSSTPTAVGLQASFIPTGDISYLASYDGSNNLSILRLGSSSIQLTGTPTITAVGSGPLTLNGSGSVNGNILLNPQSAGTNASVVIQAADNTHPGLIINNAGGSSTGNDIFEIRNSTGLSTGTVFKIVTSGDPNPNTMVSWSHFPHDTSATDTLGDSSHRWGKLWIKDIDFSGSFTGDIWLRLSGGVMTGGIQANAVNTLSIGSKPTPFSAGYFMGNVSSRRYEIYDSSASDLTSPFWRFEASAVSGLSETLHFRDLLGNDVLTLNRIATGFNNIAVLDNHWYPKTNGTYDIGGGSTFWRNLSITGAAAVGSLTCTGSPCGTPVINGFFVTNNTAVTPTPTAAGIQMSYTPSSLGDIKVYDASNNLATMRLSAAVVQLAGTPTITAVGTGPFILNGSGSGNGNIVLNPQNAGSNSSVVINTPGNTLPGLIVNNAAGSSTGNNVLEIRDSTGLSSGIVFKIITSGDPNPNTMVSWSHFPHNTGGTDTLGDTNHRWSTWASSLNVANITTVSGSILSTGVGTLDIGTTTNPFAQIYAQTVVGSRRFQVYDSSASPLTGSFWTVNASVNIGIVNRLFFLDNVGTPMLTLNRVSTGFNNTGVLDGNWVPSTDATYDIGFVGSRWRNINASGAASVGSLTCTGTPCGSTGTSVANGYFVTNNTAVTPTPTAAGIQMSYTPSSLGDIKVYDASNNPATMRLTASVIQLSGTPTITAVATGPFSLNGSGSGNGNILLTPGSISANASVRMFQTAVGQPVLKMVNTSSVVTSTIFEVDASNQTTALFWVEGAFNPTTTTGCANCVHSATMFPTTDGTFDLGGNNLRWNTFRGFAAQLGLVPFGTPLGQLQVIQNGQSLIVADAFGNGGLGIPSFVGRSANGTPTSPSPTINGDVLFSLTGRGFVSGNFTSSGSAAISMLSNENWSGGQGADIYMQTTQAGFGFGSRATRAIFTATGMNPASDNTGSLGTSGPCANGGSSPCRWNNAQFVNATIGTLNLTTCAGTGCGVSPSSNITFSGVDTFTNTVTMSGNLNLNGIGTGYQIGGVTVIDSGHNGIFGTILGSTYTSTVSTIGTVAFKTSNGFFSVDGQGNITAIGSSGNGGINTIDVVGTTYNINNSGSVNFHGGQSINFPGGLSGVTLSGTSCTITQITTGIITGAHCP